MSTCWLSQLRAWGGAGGAGPAGGPRGLPPAPVSDTMDSHGGRGPSLDPEGSRLSRPSPWSDLRPAGLHLNSSSHPTRAPGSLLSCPTPCQCQEPRLRLHLLREGPEWVRQGAADCARGSKAGLGRGQSQGCGGRECLAEGPWPGLQQFPLVTKGCLVSRGWRALGHPAVSPAHSQGQGHSLSLFF